MNLVIVQIKRWNHFNINLFCFRYPSDEESPVTIRMTEDVPIATCVVILCSNPCSTPR